MVTSSTELVTGDGRIITVEGIAKLYRDCYSVLSPSSGQIKKVNDSTFSITGVFSNVDCDTLEIIKCFKLFSLNVSKSLSFHEGCEFKSIQLVSDQRVADSTLFSSDNNRFSARLKFSTSSVNKKQLLEIWDGTRHVKTIDISDSDLHGPINVDPQFGRLQWCPFGEQDKLLYICQRKPQKNVSFFKSEKPKSSGDEGVAIQSLIERGREYDHKEDWGDGLDGIDHTILAILDVSKDCQISTIDLVGFSLSGSRWADDGNKIVSVAYPEEPRRLGLAGTNNQPSMIVVHDVTQSPVKQVMEIRDERNSYHTPRVDHSGQKLVYMTNEAYGPHFRTVHLYLYDFTTNARRLLLDKIDSTRDLFISELPDNCFSSDDKFVLFENRTQLLAETYLLNLDSSRLRLLDSNLTIFDFQHDIVLFSKSTPNKSPNLGVCAIDGNSGGAVHFHELENGIDIPDVNYEMNRNLRDPSDGTLIGSALFTWPNLDVIRKSDMASDLLSKLPTVVLVHGGPHWAFESRYASWLLFYTRLGLKTLMINYRGSTGLTKEFSESLCGKIGDVDVNDCSAIIRHYVEKRKINPTKLVIQGGSHGGFLSCHLCCRGEFKFTSAVLRNPVISMSSTHETTDTPDWISTEIFNRRRHDFSWRPSDRELLQMHKRSPDHNKTNVPTLVMLGNKDQRVKMYEGLRWMEALKARGVETKCKVYPDKHNLSRPEVQADSNIEAAIWIMQHLPVI